MMDTSISTRYTTLYQFILLIWRHLRMYLKLPVIKIWRISTPSRMQGIITRKV